MSEPLELHNQYLEADAAYKGAMRDVLFSALPAFMGLVTLAGLHKQRRRAQEAYRESAAKHAAEADRKPPCSGEPACAWERIAEALPAWAELTSDEDHWLVVDRETGRVVCAVIDPPGLVMDPVALRVWGNQLVRPE